jgi:2-C-methyl-D-erythritol 4-phosphate cytidylyltransferase/2-C-methyl-D-erythritol 2,4-cyclodiphosphate synthase
MHVAAIIVAAGKGERAGASEPKQFVDLGGGRTMLDLCVATFLATPQIDEVIVAVPPGYIDRVTIPVAASDRVHVVEGGARRQDSMAQAFAAVSKQAEVVLVHDAARPYVGAQAIAATIEAAARFGAAIVALPVRDTVKRTRVVDGETIIRETLPRSEIYLAQTPQGFQREILEQALAAAENQEVTDEAMLVERAGIPVHVVHGDATNVKITMPEDLRKARMTTTRIGTGYDLHRLVEGRPLILAGIRIPFELGLQGHSDADIVCHAVTDAMLGAVALGDIGRMFPDTDPQWKDADSITLLRAAVEVVHRAGWALGNADVTVVAERPKLLPYLDQMRANLAGALGVDVSAVSIKGKTNEQVDATGRGEAMACHAIALLTVR